MQKILFIDTMATGVSTERCAIYRIGGIYTEDGVEKARFEFRACPWPGARISDQSLWICSETRATLARYPSSADAFASLLEFISARVDVKHPSDKAYLAGFNASAFDVPLLKEWFRRNGNEHFRDYFYVQTLDVMNLSAFVLLGERRSMQGFHLEDVARKFDIPYPYGDSYDCVENAHVCLDIFRHIREVTGLGPGGATETASTFVTNFNAE